MNRTSLLLAASLSLALAAPLSAQPLDLAPRRIAQASESPFVTEASDSQAIQDSALIQHHQLQLHQGFGLATLGAMALTVGFGVYGAKYAPPSLLNVTTGTHIALGGLTTGLYLGSAVLALTAPRGYDEPESSPFDSVSLHKDLAWLHAAGLVSTLVLGVMTYNNQIDPSLHGILGGTTLGLMAASAGVIALDF